MHLALLVRQASLQYDSQCLKIDLKRISSENTSWWALEKQFYGFFYWDGRSCSMCSPLFSFLFPHYRSFSPMAFFYKSSYLIFLSNTWILIQLPSNTPIPNIVFSLLKKFKMLNDKHLGYINFFHDKSLFRRIFFYMQGNQMLSIIHFQ